MCLLVIIIIDTSPCSERCFTVDVPVPKSAEGYQSVLCEALADRVDVLSSQIREGIILDQMYRGMRTL